MGFRKKARFPLFVTLPLAALAVLGGCLRRHNPITDEVRVAVANVDLDRETGVPFVLLKEESGRRILQMVIGEPEARALLLELRGMSPPRPLTHDLMRSLVEKTGNRVDRVVVSDLRDGTYFANIYLDHGRYQIDSRPSDAIALALGAKAPIYVAARLLENADEARSDNGSPAGPETVHGLGLTVQEMTPELASYFDADPGKGILISDMDTEAAKAGIKRGDVLVKLGPQAIEGLGDFAKQASGLNGGSISITVKRGSEEHKLTLPIPRQESG